MLDACRGFGVYYAYSGPYRQPHRTPPTLVLDTFSTPSMEAGTEPVPLVIVSKEPATESKSMQLVAKPKKLIAKPKKPAAAAAAAAKERDMMQVADRVGFRYFADVLIEALKQQFLDYLMAVPEEMWKTIGSSRSRFKTTVKRRIGFGRNGENAVPEELEGLLNPILDHIMLSATEEEKRLLRVYFDQKHCFTINRYTKGMVLGQHFDDNTGPDNIVLGFTMGTKSTTHRNMIFSNPTTGESFENTTYDNSVYMFYGDMYYDYKHGSSKPVDGDVYSITIRANC